MKKYLFIALLILICSLSFTQVQWQERGIPIRQGENIKWNQTSIACSDEIFVSVWTDTRDGVRGVYAQKTDLDGNLLWGENGLEVYHSNTMQDHPIAISSDSNSIIICWKDYDFVESHLFQIRIQKIDADGNLLWGNDGNLLNNIEPDWHVPKLFNHSDGGVYYIWREGVYQDRDIYGLRLLADGSIADGWETGMQILTATGEYDVHPDGSDGLIIASVLDDDIYIQRIDEDG